MKILEEITKDLDWREKEIAAIKLLLKNQGVTKGQKEALLRAAWAMLYAHYEGFAKFCLTIFFDEVTQRSVTCSLLPKYTKEFALRRAIKKLKSLSTIDAMDELLNFNQHLISVPSFPDVDTKSNLWPELLKRLYAMADLNANVIDKHAAKLRTLVARRNSIAHGENNLITEYDYYKSYEDAVYEFMYDLAYQIDSRLAIAPYN